MVHHKPIRFKRSRVCCMNGDGVVYGRAVCWRVGILKLVSTWSWYEILFGIIGNLRSNGARTTSNRVGLFSKNNFWQVDF